MKAMRSQPHRGVTLVAYHSYGWYKGTEEKRAFRYATAFNPCCVPKGTLPIPTLLPAIGMAGYQYLMSTASAVTCHRRLSLSDAYGIGCAELAH